MSQNDKLPVNPTHSIAVVVEHFAPRFAYVPLQELNDFAQICSADDVETCAWPGAHVYPLVAMANLCFFIRFGCFRLGGFRFGFFATGFARNDGGWGGNGSEKIGAERNI